MILKFGKPANETSSNNPVSLTPILSNLWERIILEDLSLGETHNSITTVWILQTIFYSQARTKGLPNNQASLR